MVGTRSRGFFSLECRSNRTTDLFYANFAILPLDSKSCRTFELWPSKNDKDNSPPHMITTPSKFTPPCLPILALLLLTLQIPAVRGQWYKSYDEAKPPSYLQPPWASAPGFADAPLPVAILSLYRSPLTPRYLLSKGLNSNTLYYIAR